MATDIPAVPSAHTLRMLYTMAADKDSYTIEELEALITIAEFLTNITSNLQLQKLLRGHKEERTAHQEHCGNMECLCGMAEVRKQGEKKAFTLIQGGLA